LTLLPWTNAAAEEWARFFWAERWGSGSILYNRDVLPSDTVDGGATFRDSIHSYSISKYREHDQFHFQGFGGSMTTRSGQAPDCWPEDADCPVNEVIFDLGPLTSGDPTRWRVHLSARGALEPGGLPRVAFDGGDSYLGYMTNDRNDLVLGVAGEHAPVQHTFAEPPVTSPVPEPPAFVAMLAGLVLLGVKRRRGVDSRGADPVS
jgi:hypothetical protein